MSDLPILEVIPSLKSLFSQCNTVILQAPPGAGKSTQLPLELLEEEWVQGKKIVMLEPRRLAAKSVAARMAQLRGEEVGQTIGYQVRFENRTSATTAIDIFTEGILTRKLQQDNVLEGVGLVIFDEFHERSLHADLSLALCREIQQVLRPDLKILIMSATLDGEKLSFLLGNAPIITSQGRQFPIQFHYLGSDPKIPLAAQVASAVKKALKEQEGDVLTFLPRTGDIKRTMEILESIENPSLALCPLYGDLPFREQQEAILPHPQGKRKVVLATSIAETSLTIEGIKTVIDSGWSRVPQFDPKSGLTRLETVRVTVDAAQQRAGRAGRMGPGVCYRLWSEATQHQLLPHRTPEILEADLAPLMLEISQWGTQDIKTLTWLTLPPSGAVHQALELLQKIKAVDMYGKITEKGREILSLPTHPRIAHMLLEAKRIGILGLAMDVAAILEEKDPLPREQSAHIGFRIDALRKYRQKEPVSGEKGVFERIDRVAGQWRRMFGRTAENTAADYEQIGRLIALAYPERIARLKENDIGRYRLANGRVVKLPENDVLDREPWLSVAHLDAGGSREGKIFLAAPLNIDHLADALEKVETLKWDHYKGALLAQVEWKYGDMILKSSPLENISDDNRFSTVFEVAKKEGLALFDLSKDFIQLQARTNSLKSWRPEIELPDLREEALFLDAEVWRPYLSKIRKQDDFKRVNLLELVEVLFTWDQRNTLELLAPQRIKVPSGFEVELQYAPNGSDPVLAVRLQEMFGLLDTPTINEGRTKVLLHLLSPGYKPVQVTQDLKSFWRNTYPEVRKELRTRYPKHHWPEDPWTAEAVRGVKRQQK